MAALPMAQSRTVHGRRRFRHVDDGGQVQPGADPLAGLLITTGFVLILGYAAPVPQPRFATVRRRRATVLVLGRGSP